MGNHPTLIMRLLQLTLLLLLVLQSSWQPVEAARHRLLQRRSFVTQREVDVQTAAQSTEAAIAKPKLFRPVILEDGVIPPPTLATLATPEDTEDIHEPARLYNWPEAEQQDPDAKDASEATEWMGPNFYRFSGSDKTAATAAAADSSEVSKEKSMELVEPEYVGEEEAEKHLPAQFYNYASPQETPRAHPEEESFGHPKFYRYEQQ